MNGLSTASITLEEMEFFAYHGFYEEERKIGNRYSVSIVVEAQVQRAAEYDDLQHTINYEILYALTKEIMGQPALLLEHIAYRILQKIFITFSDALHAAVTVQKHNPPIGGVCKAAKVTLKMAREKAMC